MSREAPALVQLCRELRGQRPGVVLGTLRLPVDPDSDHTPWLNDTVRAVDIMGTGYDKLAANLAAKLGKHPAMGSGAYVIWRQRIISTDRKGEGWRLMPDRGSPTDNHMDHVHVSITRNPAGYNYTGKWGALFTGTGTGAAPIPQDSGGIDTSPTGAANTAPQAPRNPPGGATGVPAGLGLPGVPGVDDVAEAAMRAIFIGGALALGVVLIALGAVRLTKPIVDQANDAAGDVVKALPQTKAATAATAATKGAP